MEHRVEWVYSPAQTARAGRALWWRCYAGPWAFYTAGPTLTLVFCLASGEFASSRAGCVVLGFLAGVVATSMLLAAYWYRSLSSSKSRRELIGVTLSYTFDAEGIKARTPQGSGAYPWPSVKAVARKRDFWIFSIEGDALTLPADLLDAQARVFIESQVVAAGGRID